VKDVSTTPDVGVFVENDSTTSGIEVFVGVSSNTFDVREFFEDDFTISGVGVIVKIDSIIFVVVDISISFDVRVFVEDISITFGVKVFFEDVFTTLNGGLFVEDDFTISGVGVCVVVVSIIFNIGEFVEDDPAHFGVGEFDGDLSNFTLIVVAFTACVFFPCTPLHRVILPFRFPFPFVVGEFFNGFSANFSVGAFVDEDSITL
ncbi:hypothetical protein chiPu_0026291, partial [Chiloscyllium punctatum]|nr:hypothetical protein [Chiloscyllium punctatum]